MQIVWSLCDDIEVTTLRMVLCACVLESVVHMGFIVSGVCFLIRNICLLSVHISPTLILTKIFEFSWNVQTRADKYMYTTLSWQDTVFACFLFLFYFEYVLQIHMNQYIAIYCCNFDWSIDKPVQQE